MTQSATPQPPHLSPSEGDRLARRNAVVLSASMALAGANAAVVISTGSLVGKLLAPSPALATLPVSTFVLGTALFTFPASFLMKRIGRRAGFMVGGLAGIMTGLLSAAAVWYASFWLYALATTFAGAYQSFVVLYRYAAADTASPAFRPKAISWVMTGGVLAALVGPQLVIQTKDMFSPLMFLGTYLGQAIVAVIAIAVVGQFRDGPPVNTAVDGVGRPLSQVIAVPKFVVAVLCGLVAQSMMNMVMTATPIAMVGCGFSVTDSTLGIQWHVLAMYLPSFFCGSLIARFGKGRVVFAGLILLMAAGGLNLAGTALWNFWGALILLGLGWNFAFVGATAMVTDCHSPAERAKVQGFTDFTIFGATTVASFMAGYLYDSFGWSAVNWVLVPMTLIAMLAVIVTGQIKRPVSA